MSTKLEQAPIDRWGLVGAIGVDVGQCWIGDPLRSAASDFAKLARERGYHVTIDCGDAGPRTAGNRSNFQLLILRRCPG